MRPAMTTLASVSWTWSTSVASRRRGTMRAVEPSTNSFITQSLHRSHARGAQCRQNAGCNCDEYGTDHDPHYRPGMNYGRDAVKVVNGRIKNFLTCDKLQHVSDAVDISHEE